VRPKSVAAILDTRPCRTPPHRPLHPLDFVAKGSVSVIALSEEHTMSNAALSNALSALFPMITERLKQAHNIAAAAQTCAATGNYESAFRILLDVEQPTFEATTLLNAASLIRHDAE